MLKGIYLLFFQVDLFCYKLIIVPVHLGVHWCLAVIDFRNKTVKYYDSMGSTNNKCLQVDEIVFYSFSTFMNCEGDFFLTNC